LCENDLILPSDLLPHIVGHVRGDKQDHVLASMPVGQPLDDRGGGLRVNSGNRGQERKKKENFGAHYLDLFE